MIPAEGVVEITTADDLLTIDNFPTRDYVLTNDIDLANTTFNGLCSEENPFTGTFDGNGYIIKGWNFNDSNVGTMGLFKRMDGAVIKNLGMTGVAIVGGDNTGALVGIADGGKIERCYVSNSNIEGGDRVSAIAARVSAGVIIENCYAAQCTIKARTHQAGGISAASFDGGATISNCYFDGTITSQFGHFPCEK